jgi:HSP20 family protein
MSTKDPVDWMLSDAIGTLVRAERPHQQFLKLRPLVGTREPCWEPPIDVLETDREVLILIALPGVDPGDVEAVIDEGVLVVSGRRVLPPELRNARILRRSCPRDGSSAASSCRWVATRSPASPLTAASARASLSQLRGRPHVISRQSRDIWRAVHVIHRSIGFNSGRRAHDARRFTGGIGQERIRLRRGAKITT